MLRIRRKENIKKLDKSNLSFKIRFVKNKNTDENPQKEEIATVTKNNGEINNGKK